MRVERPAPKGSTGLDPGLALHPFEEQRTESVRGTREVRGMGTVQHMDVGAAGLALHTLHKDLKVFRDARRGKGGS